MSYLVECMEKNGFPVPEQLLLFCTEEDKKRIEKAQLRKTSEFQSRRQKAIAGKERAGLAYKLGKY